MVKTSRARALPAAALATLGLLAAGCSDSAGSASNGGGTGTAAAAVDKAGRSDAEAARTLRLVTISSPERPRGAVAARFAEELTALGGPLGVDVQYESKDPVGDFTSGRADMILMPTLELDTLGVTSFEALTFPLLIDDDAQADRVAEDPVIGEMMAGLGSIGATGLFTVPVAPIHLALQGDQPLRTLDQLEPGVRAVPRSVAVSEVYEALGTRAVYDLDDDAWAAAVDAGEVAAKEFPTALVGVGPLPVVMATNLTLYYDFVVLAVRNQVLDELSAAQVADLEQAAASARGRSIDERLRDDAAFRNECAKGVALSAAPITLWAQIGRSLDDLLLDRLQDPVTRATYEAVRRAAGQRTVAWPEECSNGKVTAYEPPTTVGGVPANGTYRVDGRTVEQLRVSGVSDDTATPGNEVDYWEMSFQDGAATLTNHYPDGRVTSASSTYSVDADGILRFTSEDGLGGAFAWTQTDDELLLEPAPTDAVFALNETFDVAGLGLLEFTRVR